MKKAVKAQIKWTPVEIGGRTTILPVGMRYCPIIVFDSEQTGETLWSAEIYNTSIQDRTSTADISYLSNKAPFHLLQSGGKFQLYEGQRIVAEGAII